MSRSRTGRMLRACIIGLSVGLAGGAAAQLAPPHFPADGSITGSSLTGWTSLGSADWEVRNGEVIGTPRRPQGGWLLLDKSMANVGFYSQIQCTGSCRAGVLLRAEKTPDGGMKGVYVALSDADRGVYAVTLNADGVETTRTKLKEGRSFGGLPDPMANTPPHVLEAMKTKRRDVPLPPGVTLPALETPSGRYLPGQWNSLNIYLFQDALAPSLNGAPTSSSEIPQSIVPTEAGRYGPIALYVGGEGSARFRGVQYKDLTERVRPPEMVSKNFRMQRLDGYFYSWSPVVADYDHDGNMDVAAGPWIYLGPDFTRVREYYTPVAYNPTTDYPQLSTVAVTQDFTGDGWDDIVQFTGNAGYITGILYVNPKNESRHWDSYKVLDLVANEETLLKDIDGDGVPEVLHGGPDYSLGYSKPDPSNPTGPWITTKIAGEGPWGGYTNHGIGAGDINGDGRVDFITPYGWWEQPAKPTGALWKYHPASFARRGISQGGAGGAELGVYDVNGDGLNDVVSTLEGHGFGLAWNEQKRSSSGEISFVQHMIMDGYLDKNAGGVMFTEPHAAAYVDIDGDGLQDIITGKRALSHLTTWYDPDPYGAPVLYVYKAVRNKAAPGGAEFVPELVHNFSGVGAHFQVTDMNKDGKADIVTSGPYGTFLFFNETAQSTR